jgi:small GTP-binding protein
LSELAFKICIFGDGGVGKTTLVRRYITGAFEEDLKMSIGVDITIKRIEVNGLNVMLQIWDFAGEYDFKHLLPHYAAGAHGGIIAYDVSRLVTLNHIGEWLDTFRQTTSGSEFKIPILLLGCKSDLELSRSVFNDNVIESVHNHNLDADIECSAKNGSNVKEVFSKIAVLAMKSHKLI